MDRVGLRCADGHDDIEVCAFVRRTADELPDDQQHRANTWLFDNEPQTRGYGAKTPEGIHRWHSTPLPTQVRTQRDDTKVRPRCPVCTEPQPRDGIRWETLSRFLDGVHAAGRSSVPLVTLVQYLRSRR